MNKILISINYAINILILSNRFKVSKFNCYMGDIKEIGKKVWENPKLTCVSEK